MKILRRSFVLILLAFTSVSISCESLDSILPLSNNEIIEGLKKALSIGLDTSVTSASSTDGYLKNEAIKILLPAKVTDLQNKIKTEKIGLIPLSVIYAAYMGFKGKKGDLFDDLTSAMDKGAENASKKALPIFSDALTSMSIDDARGLLDGGDNSATDYFQTKTTGALVKAFNPEVKTALEGTGALQTYKDIVGFLNYKYDPTGFFPITPSQILKINLPENIDEYATNKAITGLFHLVGGEEKKIRDNPSAWGSAIIEKVFGSK